MKIRNAAPLLLTGWILMVPPDSTVPHSVDPAAPMFHWMHIAKFNNASDCQNAVAALNTRNPDIPVPLDPTGELRRFQRRQPADPQLALARVRNATCLASDDPRLTK
ncbi:MAG TPA: hypothetical protein VKB29_08455 [Candidatus Binataceae bacterium]|nr:hypothetical protein [Candidatus Binataceae bacterium]